MNPISSIALDGGEQPSCRDLYHLQICDLHDPEGDERMTKLTERSWHGGCEIRTYDER
jgi:hypothetical protein